MQFHTWLAAVVLVVCSSFSAVCAPPPDDDSLSESLTEAKANSVQGSVVKVFSTVRYPDYFKPWTKQAPTELTGSGVVIEGKRILSNAHLLLYSSEVQIQASQAGDKISARVEAISPTMDLAVLKLEDETFFETHPPLAQAKGLPEIQDSVTAYGYPRGGSGLSITKGIVSRIEYASYNFPAGGLRIQIDAAINPGNSGGPVVSQGQMIGLIYSTLVAGQNIGYIIPNEEINLFLKDIADGHYDGKPMLMDGFQILENPALRAYLKLDKQVKGVVVKTLASKSPSYPLKPWDVVTKIGDSPVDDQGLVKTSHNLRVSFRYLVQKIARKGKVPLTVLRQGKELQVEVPVTNSVSMLTPFLNGEYPPYFVYGPMVFSTASADMVGLLSRGATGGSYLISLAVYGSPLLTHYGEEMKFPGEQMVIVSSPFFPHKLTKGYFNPALMVVKTVNGTQVKSLGHLVTLLRDCREEFITIEYYNRSTETMVFPRAEMAAATEDILSENGLRKQGSDEVMAIWKGK